MLACDSQGVLPPVSKLSKEQALYHFLSGFTSYKPLNNGKMINTNPNFSACYSEAILSRHPTVYTEMLEKKIQAQNCNVWLVNTGWIKGKFEEGQGQVISISPAHPSEVHQSHPRRHPQRRARQGRVHRDRHLQVEGAKGRHRRAQRDPRSVQSLD